MTTRALTIVAKYPEPGLVKTRLAAAVGADVAAALYRAFLADLAKRFTRAARRDGYSLIWAQAPGSGDLRDIAGADARVLAQRGDDFAARLHNICADLASTGIRELVVMSSDSPHLPADWVRLAFAAVARGRVALGPAMDGGYYLIGLRTDPPLPDLFSGIEMSTERVLVETRARAASLGLAVDLLPTTFDVDEVGALSRLAQALAKPGPRAAPSPRTRAALAALASSSDARRDAVQYA
jgi:rSAM/selenodomain-associated transferase 1